MVIADLGYRDDKVIIPMPTTNMTDSSLHKRIRARHETVNSRLKNFAVLRHIFRHDLELHSDCFYAALNITQLTLSELPLFSIFD